MNRATGMAVGVAFVVAVGIFISMSRKSPAPPASAVGAATAEQIEELRQQIGRVENALSSRNDRAQALDRTLARIETRLRAVENRPVTAAEVANPPEEGVDEPQDATIDGKRREFRALMDKVLEGDATADEQTRFWKLARETDMVEQLIGDLESRVKAEPQNVDSRMNLAQAYIAKLLSIPGGPEQGVWAMKAENQWREVIKQDEDHWEANYSIGESWSWYPVQLGKTPDAIKQFEKVRTIQEGLTPEKQHVGTYLRLSMLYNRQNNEKKAREALDEGLRRHPDDERLTKALETMGEPE